MAIPTLVLGTFNLTDWSGSAYNTAIIAEGTSRGAPVPLEVAVQSWLQDGSVVVTQGYDNRTVTLRVKMRGPSLTAVAQAEAALHAQLGIPNTLTWTPASGPASVFVVVTSSMEFSPSDAEDIAEGGSYPWRTYNLRLVCEAHVRSVAEVTSPSLPASGATTTVLDAMSATTGWTGTADGVSATPSVASGAVSVSLAAPTVGAHTLTMQKTFAATTSTTSLLVVDYKVSHTGGQVTATGDGTLLKLVAQVASPTAGYTRAYWKVAAPSLAVTKFTWVVDPRATSSPVSSTLVLSVDNIAVTNAFGSGRQQGRSLDVRGSARTPGCLAVESATAALGNDVKVYVYPATEDTIGYDPALRQFKSANPGATNTPNAAMVSGSSETFSASSGLTIQIPLNLFPWGKYTLIGRLSATSAASYTFNMESSTLVGSTAVAAEAKSKTLALTTSMADYPMGQWILPTTDLDPQTPALLRLNINIAGGSTAPSFDELWFYNTTIGQLIWTDCGTGSGAVGGAARRLFIEAPTVYTPRPTVRIGHSADRSDSFHPAGTVKSWQVPQFVPPQVNVHVVTPNVNDATINLRHYPRWHSHAAE